MNLETRKLGKICVLDFTGKVTISEGTAEFRDKFRELLESGERHFVLNMLGVPWLDSSAIGEVVASYKRIRDREGVLKLALLGKAHDLFTFYELGKIIEIYDSVEDALSSFVP